MPSVKLKACDVPHSLSLFFYTPKMSAAAAMEIDAPSPAEGFAARGAPDETAADATAPDVSAHEEGSVKRPTNPLRSHDLTLWQRTDALFAHKVKELKTAHIEETLATWKRLQDVWFSSLKKLKNSDEWAHVPISVVSAISKGNRIVMRAVGKAAGFRITTLEASMHEVIAAIAAKIAPGSAERRELDAASPKVADALQEVHQLLTVAIAAPSPHRVFEQRREATKAEAKARKLAKAAAAAAATGFAATAAAIESAAVGEPSDASAPGALSIVVPSVAPPAAGECDSDVPPPPPEPEEDPAPRRKRSRRA